MGIMPDLISALLVWDSFSFSVFLMFCQIKNMSAFISRLLYTQDSSPIGFQNHHVVFHLIACQANPWNEPVQSAHTSL